MAETKKTTKAAKPVNPEKEVAKGNIAVILLRSTVRASAMLENALSNLHLRKKNTCAVFPNTISMRGMVFRVKDFVTYGEIDDATQALLVEKRGQKGADGKTLAHFHLSPPRGGYERKGIKVAFDNGGALGNRGVKINDLIKRMI
jgi:large subunit ribosomal protein L30